MKWSYEEFKNSVFEFFYKRNWNIENDDVLEKGYISQFPNKNKQSNLISDNHFFEYIVPLFKESGLKNKVQNNLKNSNKDTDLIIAGFQTAFNQFEINTNKESWYSFQPVVRLNNLNLCGKIEGYISSFVNLCIVEIDISIRQYLYRIDWWIDILSKLSLHVSGLKLLLKRKTTKFEGYGIEFQYKGIEIGQANLYRFVTQQGECLVSDFGFGYERLLWAINGGKNFYYPLFDKFDIKNDNIFECDKIRTAILLIMTGIIPAANGVGRHVKSLISKATVLNIDRFLDLRIKRYYDYYSKFLQPKFCGKKIKDIYRGEIDNLYLKQLYRDRGIRCPTSFKGDFFEEYEKLFFIP